MTSSLPSTSISTDTTTMVAPSNEPSLFSCVLVVINVATQIPLKLTKSTYFSWRKQFDVLLIGYDLYGLFNGNLSCPSPTFSDQFPNLDYSFWIRQESLLLGMLLASLSPEVHQIVATTETSKDAWDLLASAFAKPSYSRLLQIGERLIKAQSNRSVLEYLNDNKNAEDELSLLDHLDL
ncbi:uncharacterized protein LOC132804962 [Ziziphus jujuba]|uniref:Uncharacterized protein LOC132804962 n=1 Tax=Ziziphus jujuba TaxID=326968 RepID=A0ABM4AFF5_ZIZJJ|nr:uncharacterized protein LOC132804962 [Ziziphus jujuba]